MFNTEEESFNLFCCHFHDVFLLTLYKPLKNVVSVTSYSYPVVVVLYYFQLSVVGVFVQLFLDKPLVPLPAGFTEFSNPGPAGKKKKLI